MVFHFSYPGCVPESASNSGQKGGSRFGPGFSQFLKVLRTCIMPGIWPKTRSESQLQAFHRAIALLGVVTALGKQVPYVRRHTGASADAWAQRRSLTEIQVRGRWKFAGSVRRCDKGGRVANQMSACSEPLQRVARLCEAAIPDILVRLQPPVRPPAHPPRRTPSASCSLIRLIGWLKLLPVKVNWCLQSA